MKQRYILALIAMFSILYGCVEDPEMPDGIRNANKPVVETLSPSSATAVGFSVSGTVEKENGAKVTKRGFLLSLSNPVTAENKPKEVEAEGDNSLFTYRFTDLDNDTEYYVAAFAENIAGRTIGDSYYIKTQTGLGEVTTSDATDIKAESATAGGKIINAGEGTILARGVYYSTSSIAASNTNVNTAVSTMQADSFVCDLTNLLPDTKYYFKAYITNEFGTIVGLERTFTTTTGLPKLGSFEQVGVSFTDAVFKATVTDIGESAVISRGFCWGTANGPTIANDTIQCEGDLGEFTGTIDNLQPFTRYYVRAFVENSYGVTYSTESITVVTLNNLPTISTTSITLGNAVINVSGEVQDEGITAVTEYGVCWAIGSTPTIADSKLALGSGSGAFSGQITGVRGGETYYVCVYATNSADTKYGDVVQLTTPDIFQVSASFNGGSITPGSASYFMIENEAYLFGGDLGASNTDALWQFTPSGGFTQKQSASSAVSWASAVGYEQTVFILGGYDSGNNVTNNLIQYLPQLNNWSPLSITPAPTAVAAAMGARLGLQICYVGGIRESGSPASKHVSNEVWLLNPLSGGSWTEAPNFPVAMYGGVMVSSNNVLYAGLGKTAIYPTAYSNKLWQSTDSGTSWTELTTFTGGNVEAGVELNGSLYVVTSGGYIWKCNLTNGTWERKSQLASANRSIHCLYAVNGVLYIGLGNSSNTVIKYDPLWDN